MLVHTNDFKNNINKNARQIKGKIIYYNSYNLVAESGDNILTENDLYLISENPNYSDPIEISQENILQMEFVKNGNLLQSLMKEFDFEAKVDLNIGFVVNPQFGVLISDSYELLNYGNYVIYSKEYNADTDSWSYVCYDKMLFSMVKYRGIEASYPITIKEYINRLCSKVGLEFQDSTFVNQSELIYEDIYKDKNLTIRDIFDQISKIAGGNLIINASDKLAIKYPTATGDTINENYLRNNNVKFNKKIGPINSVVIYDNENKLEYVAEDTTSIKTNGLTKITITDNLLALNGDGQNIADNILDKLKGLSYYIIDVQTAGVCYYEFLDLFNISANSVNYNCLLLNNEITITSGLEEHIFNEELKEVETSSNEYTTSIISNKQVQFRINQQQGEIESKVEKDGVISAINQSAEEIKINANKLSFEGATINMTADNVKIKGENLDIDSKGIITLTDNSAEVVLQGGNLKSAYVIESENTIERSGTIENLKFKNQIFSQGRNLNLEENWEYEGTTGGFINGIIESVYSQPRLRLYTQSNDYDAVSSTGSYQDLSLSLGGGISYNNIYNGTTSNPLSITPDGQITCVRVIQTSLKEKKKNFEKLKNAKEILNATDIYKYNFVNEEDNVKKSIGFVIGDDFNYSKEITSENNDGANIYSMVAVLWQVVKEQQKEIKEQQKEIEELKEMIKNGKS